MLAGWLAGWLIGRAIKVELQLEINTKASASLFTFTPSEATNSFWATFRHSGAKWSERESAASE